MSNPRACDTITDVTACLFIRRRESSEKANFGSPKALQPGQRDRTGRNMTKIRLHNWQEGRGTTRAPQQMDNGMGVELGDPLC